MIMEHPVGRIIRATVANIERMEEEFRLMQSAPLAARSEKVQDIASMYILLENLHNFMDAIMSDDDEDEEKENSSRH